MSIKYIDPDNYKPGKSDMSIVHFKNDDYEYNGPDLVIKLANGDMGFLNFDSTIPAGDGQFDFRIGTKGKIIKSGEMLGDYIEELTDKGYDFDEYAKLYTKYIIQLLEDLNINKSMILKNMNIINDYVDQLGDYLA